MQISTKGRYALRFLLDLSQHQDQGPVALKSIAERQGISKKYLEHVISMLNPTGMLNITRGYQGGYRLAKDPSDITVADVLRATEGGLAPVPYVDGHVLEVLTNWGAVFLDDVVGAAIDNAGGRHHR